MARPLQGRGRVRSPRPQLRAEGKADSAPRVGGEGDRGPAEAPDDGSRDRREARDGALTVSRWLRRIGLGKLSRLDPPEPPNRYERKCAGELVHVDVKKLGRFKRPGHRVTGRQAKNRRTIQTGWDFCHVCVDDATRLAYVEVLEDEKAATAIGFLRRAITWFAAMGITVERVMSDNGACYRSHAHAAACRELEIRHLRTQPYRPRTNGKAERFIQTLQNKWAYGAVYQTSKERTAALPGWLNHYNFTRRHGALGHKPPGARLRELEQRP